MLKKYVKYAKEGKNKDKRKMNKKTKEALWNKSQSCFFCRGRKRRDQEKKG